MTDSSSSLQTLWLCEAVRLREEQTGLLEDTEACRKARATAGSLAQRLQARGLFLAQRDGLVAALQHWLQGAKLAVWLLIISARRVAVNYQRSSGGRRFGKNRPQRYTAGN